MTPRERHVCMLQASASAHYIVAQRAREDRNARLATHVQQHAARISRTARALYEAQR